MVSARFGVTVNDVQEMVDACAEHGVQFMDGVMFMHSRRLDRLRSVIDDGESVGQIKRINTHFSFCAPDEFLQSNIRVNSKLEPLGVGTGLIHGRAEISG